MGTTIDHLRQHIFCHVSKTGGTSVSEALSKFETLPWLRKLMRKANCRTHKILGWQFVSSHESLAEVEELIGSERFNAYTKWTIVRHPGARLFSMYRYIRESSKHGKCQAVSAMAFESFVQACCNEWYSPQVEKLLDRSGEFACDIVVQLEHLDQDITRVARRIGLDLQIPHLNTSSSSKFSWREAYDAASREMILYAYKRDFEMLGYDWEGPIQRVIECGDSMDSDVDDRTCKGAF